MNIAVYCGSIVGKDEIYANAARELGAYIGKSGHALVYGASDTGLMREVSKAAHDNGAKIYGVGIILFEKTVGWPDYIDDLHVAQDFAERKARMVQLADAFIALPGGLGTLDEMSEVSCESKFYYPNKEIIFYNINGYYDGIKQWLAHAEKEGFIYDGALKHIHFASNLEEIAAILG